MQLPENSKIIWQPDSLPGEPLKVGRQSDYLAADEDWVGMDGGKGSGKTDMLIFDCLKEEKITNPRWLGVIFRREYKRLEEVMARATFWLNQLPQLKAHWQGSPHYRFMFPSGARLAFHNVEHIGDEEKYQGWEICDLKFDQLEEFIETQFNYLVMQNRVGSKDLRPTVRWTANPWGVGRSWIKKRFIDNKETGRTHSLIVEAGGRQYVKTYRRVFATVFDNPVYANDESYLATLASEPNPEMRKAMFEGDWDALPGSFFSTFSPTQQLVEPFEIEPAWQLIGSLDPGWGGFLSFGLQARDFDGVEYRISTYYEEARGPEEHALAINEFIDTCKFTGGRRPSMIVSGHDAWSKKDRQAIIASEKTMADVFAANKLFLSRATLDRANGWGALIAAMPNQYKIFKHHNTELVDQLAQTLTDERKPFDIQGCGNDPKVPDHALDDARYGHMALWKPLAQPKKPPPPKSMDEYMQREFDKIHERSMRPKRLSTSY